MRIGLDARTIFRSNRRGTGKNLIDLYRHVAALRSDWQFRLYHQSHEQKADFRASNIEPRRIDMIGDRFDTWANWRLPAAAWWDRIDLLHCPANHCPAWLPRPTMVTIHDLIPLDLPGNRPTSVIKRFECGVRNACRRAAWIITPSQYTRNRLVVEFGADADRITVNPWAPDSSMRRLDDEQSAPICERYGLSERFAIHFGGADPRKNTARVINAWASLPKATRGDWQLLIVGLDPATMQRMQQHVDQACSDTAARNSIVLHGFADEADLPALLNGAELLVYPSLSEGFGLPILDAFVAGAAVLTSNNTSMPEVAGQAAALVNPYDTTDIAAFLERLMTDDARRARLVVQGTERVKQYTWSSVATRYVGAVCGAVGLGDVTESEIALSGLISAGGANKHRRAA